MTSGWVHHCVYQTMKTYHTYFADSQQAETKLKRAESQRVNQSAYTVISRHFRRDYDKLSVKVTFISCFVLLMWRSHCVHVSRLLWAPVCWYGWLLNVCRYTSCFTRDLYRSQWFLGRVYRHRNHSAAHVSLLFNSSLPCDAGLVGCPGFLSVSVCVGTGWHRKKLEHTCIYVLHFSASPCIFAWPVPSSGHCSTRSCAGRRAYSGLYMYSGGEGQRSLWHLQIDRQGLRQTSCGCDK